MPVRAFRGTLASPDDAHTNTREIAKLASPDDAPTTTPHQILMQHIVTFVYKLAHNDVMSKASVASGTACCRTASKGICFDGGGVTSGVGATGRREVIQVLLLR
jgi:hypothetical protein